MYILQLTSLLRKNLKFEKDNLIKIQRDVKILHIKTISQMSTGLNIITVFYRTKMIEI